MKKLAFGGVRLSSWLGDVGLLVLRVFAGLSVALAHGWAKTPPDDSFTRTVTGLGLPPEAAYLSMLAELVGGLALALGFATRPAALALIGNFVVAGFFAHAADPYLRKELPFLFLAVSIMFLCVGGGRFSVDRLIRA